MVLLDDSFKTIVAAVEEGRGIYDNIRKFVIYLLSCNLAEIFIVFFAALLALPMPFVAVQILWINLVTDTFPALVLGVDPKSAYIMARGPRSPKEHVVSREAWINILLIAMIITTVVLLLFERYLGVMAQTIAFTSLVMLELAMPFVIRSRYRTKMFSNAYLFGAIALSFLLQIFVIYTPLNKVFETVKLGLTEWLWILALTFLVLLIGLALEAVSRRFTEKKQKK